MVNLFNFDEELVAGFVSEFAEVHAPGAEYGFACIYRSADYPDERQVFRVALNDQHFALKIDTQSPATGRLAREFNLLRRLHDHFAGYKKVAVVEPVYVSPGEQFFVTRHIDRKTATETIYADVPSNRAAQVYRRAGHWLHAMHAFQPAQEVRFWHDWMFEMIEHILTNTIPQADRAEFTAIHDQLRQEVQSLSQARDIKVFCHGDFHGRNLILGSGVTYGLDFTEAAEKLAVYDIVDFLKADVFRDAPGNAIDRSGIIAQNKQMFFRLYRHPINMDVLDFCMRARLVIDWLAISQEAHARTSFQRKKFDRLRARVLQAFQHSFQPGKDT